MLFGISFDLLLPDTWFHKLLPLWCEEEEESICCPFECEAFNEKSEEYEVGEDGSEVCDLSRPRDTILEGEVEEEPADGQTAGQVGIRETETRRNVRILLQNTDSEVQLLR